MHALAHGARTFLPSLVLIALAVAFVLAFVLGVLPAILAAAGGAAQ
jgi:ABC-type antimicrobial peptide transport system permease subunit